MLSTILTTAPSKRCCYYHFTDEKLRQRAKVPRSCSSTQQIQDSNPVLFDSQIHALSIKPSTLPSGFTMLYDSAVAASVFFSLAFRASSVPLFPLAPIRLASGLAQYHHHPAALCPRSSSSISPSPSPPPTGKKSSQQLDGDPETKHTGRGRTSTWEEMLRERISEAQLGLQSSLSRRNDSTKALGRQVTVGSSRNCDNCTKYSGVEDTQIQA